MRLSELNEKQAALIDPRDRPLAGLGPVLAEPLANIGENIGAKVRKKERKLEKAEQQRLCGWLRLNDISFDQDRMDKRRTGTAGWPDFNIVHDSRCLLGELKMHGNKLSESQILRQAELLRNGTEVQLWHSFEEARRQILNWFWTEFRITLGDPP